MPFVIGSDCLDVKDKTCVEHCPVDCIYEGERKMYIHPGECIECGACEPVCPVEAIFLSEDATPSQAGHVEANTRFFSSLGSPGGASSVGALGRDSLPDEG